MKRWMIYRVVCSLLILGGLLSMHADTTEGTENGKWYVRSIYKDPIRHTWKNEIVWSFKGIAVADGYRMEVSDASGRLILNAVMVFDRNFAMTGLTRQSEIRQKVYTLKNTYDPDKPVVIADALVPCNWPNGVRMEGEAETQSFQITEVVGGTRFVTDMIASSKVISAQDAFDQGMLENATAGNLVLLTVWKQTPDGRKQEMVKQLWRAGDSFWLYEETPTRKSFLSFSMQ